MPAMRTGEITPIRPERVLCSNRRDSSRTVDKGRRQIHSADSSGSWWWWRPPLASWSAPSCQILLLVAVARLAGPSRKGASRTASASLAVAVTLLQDFQTLSQQRIPAAPCESVQGAADSSESRSALGIPRGIPNFFKFVSVMHCALFLSVNIGCSDICIRLPSRLWLSGCLLLPEARGSAVCELYLGTEHHSRL